MIGELNHAEIEKILKQQMVGHLACLGDDYPYVVPVSYAYDGNDIYVRATEGKKMDMLRTNPKVCFQVEEFKNMADWKSVIAFGEFEELTDPEERSKGMQVLLDRTLPLLSSQTTHLGTYWPFRPEDLNSIPGVVFRLRLADKTGRFERPDVTPQ